MARKRLTEDQKKEIRRLAAEGHTQSALAALFEVSTMTIHRVTNPEYYAKTLERSKEYQRENGERIRKLRNQTRRDYRISFGCKTDAAVIEQMDKQENVSEYIRTLVTDDIEKNKTSK